MGRETSKASYGRDLPKVCIRVVVVEASMRRLVTPPQFKVAHYALNDGTLTLASRRCASPHRLDDIPA